MCGLLARVAKRCAQGSLIGLILLAGAAPAATRTWSGAGANALWQTVANWDAAPEAGDALTFGGTVRLVNTNDFPALTQFGGLLFDASAGAFTLRGNAIELAGEIANSSASAQTVALALSPTGLLAITCDGALTLSGELGGFGLTKAGNATLTLAATNTYFGAVTNNAGLLLAKTASSLPGYAAQPVVVNAGVLGVSAGGAGQWSAAEIDGLLANPQSSFAPGSSLGIDTAGGSFTYALNLTKGGLGLIKYGGNTLTLSGANSFPGGVVNSGANGIISVGSSTALGSGTAIISGGRRFTLASGVVVNNDFVLGPNSGEVGYGLIEAASGAGTIAGSITISNGAAGGGTFGSAGTNATLYLNGPIISPNIAVSLRRYNAVFSGGGNYSNLLVTGTAKIGLDNGVCPGAVLDVASSANGIFDLNGKNQTLAGLTRNRTDTTAVVTNSNGAAGGVLTLNIAEARSYTYSGLLRGANLALTKSGAGTFTLTAVNTYNQVTKINGGRLVGQVGGSCNNSDVWVYPGEQPTMVVKVTDRTKQWSCKSLTFRDDTAGTLGLEFDFGAFGTAVAPSTTLAPLKVNGNVVIGAIIPLVTVNASNLAPGTYPLLNWTGILDGTPPSAVTLPAHVDGSLTVSGKTLQLVVTANRQPLTWEPGTGDWDISTTANWKDSGAVPAVTTYDEPTLPGAAVVFDDRPAGDGPFAVTLAATVTPASVTFTNENKAYTLAGGELAGGAALTKLGAGALTLETGGTFSGGVTLGGGLLTLNSPAALGAAAGTFTLNGGTLDCTAAGPVTLASNPAQWNTDLLFLGGQSLDMGLGGVTLSANRTVTVNGSSLSVGGLAGAGFSLTKKGPGALALNGSGTYSGGTSIEAGTVSVGAAGGLGAGPVAMAPGTVLNLNATTAGNITYSGLSDGLSGTGTVNVTLVNTPNTSTRVLNGDYSDFVGTWNIGVGAPAFAGKAQMNGLDSPDMAINVLSNGTLYVSAAGTHVSPVTLYGGDTGERLGQLRLDGGAVWAGPVVLAGDILAPTNAIVGTQTGPSTISGSITEAGGPRLLSKGGGGTLILSGANAYSGGTSVRGGALQFNANESIGGGDITIDGGVRLQLADGVTVTNTIIVGPNVNTTGRGVVESEGGSVTLTGPIIVNNASAAGGLLGAYNGSTLNVNGPVLCSIATLSARMGTIVFSGGGAYSRLNNGQDTVRLGADNGLCTTATVEIATAAGTAGFFDLAGYRQTLSGIEKGPDGASAAIGNSSTNSDSELIVTGTSTYNGVLQDALGTGTRKLALTVSGGTLTLTGANSQSGATAVRDSGTLAFGHDGALGDAPAAATPGRVVLSNGTLRATASATLSPNRGVTLAAGTSNTLDSASASVLMAYAGAIEGAGALTVLGAGGWDLGGASTYTGGTTLSGGLLALGGSSAGPAGNPSSGPLGAGAAAVTFAGGQVRATTAYGVSGATVGNPLVFAVDTTFPSGESGALHDKPLAFTGPATLTGSRTLTVEAAAPASVSLLGAIGDGGSGYGLTKAGPGTLALGGGNTYSGATALDAGKLVLVTGGSCDSSALTTAGGTTLGVRVTDSAQPWSCAGLTFSSGAASTLEFDFGATAPSTAQAPLQVAGDVDFAGTPSVTVLAESLASGAAYPLLTWTGAQNGTAPSAVALPPHVSGSLRVEGNTLYLDVSAGFRQPLRWAAASETWDVGATFNWVDGATPVPGAAAFENADTVQFEDTQSGAGPITVTLNTAVAPASVTVNNPTKDYTLAGSGKISGAAGLAKSGAGTLTLATANDFSGAAAISGGTVVLGAPSGLGSAAGETTVSGGAVLDLNGQAADAEPVNLSGASLLNASASAASLPGPVTVLGASDLGGAGDLTLSGVLGGSAPLTKVGANTLVLSGTNTHAGTLAISAGTVRTAHPSALGSPFYGTTVAGGSTLDLFDQNLGAEPVTAVGAGAGGAGALVNTGATGQNNALRFVTLAGDTTVGGSGRWDLRAAPTASLDMGGFTLSKAGGNQVSLVGAAVANPGHVDVTQGTFSLEGATALGGSAANVLAVRGGATLQFWSLTAPAGWSLALSNSATVIAGAGTGAQNNWSGPVTLDGAVTYTGAGAQTVRGAMTGAGPLTKTGAGTLTLTADNTYGGGTAVLGGTLQLGDGVATNGSVLGDIGVDSTLTFANPLPQLYEGAINGTGVVSKTANGVLSLTGASTYTGETQFRGGVLNVGTIADYGVPCAVGARQLLQERGTGTLIGLHFLGGTLQYTGAAPQSTDRQIRILRGVTNTIDASGTGDGTLSFTYSGKNTNFWDNTGARWLRLTGSNTGTNVFAINIQNQTNNATTLIKSGSGRWLVTNTHNGDKISSVQRTYSGYDGGTRIEGGWLGFVTNGLGSAGTITLTGSSVLEWYGVNAQDLSARLRLEDGVTATLNIGDNNVNLGTALALGPTRSAGLTKSGSGTLTLSSTNLFTGLTVVRAGTLRLGVTNALMTASAVELDGGALDLNGKRQTLASLTGSGTLKMNPATGAPASDRLVVSGDLDLSAVTLSLTNLSALVRTQDYRIATAGNLIGAFAAVTPSPVRSGWWPRYDAGTGTVAIHYTRHTLLILR